MSQTRPDDIRLDYAPPGVRTRRQPLSRRQWQIIVTCLLLGTLALIAFAIVPRSSRSRGPGSLQVSMLRPGIAGLLPLLAIAGFALPLTATVILMALRRVVAGLLVLLAIGGVGLPALSGGLIRGWSRWTLCSELSTSDGTRYCFIDTSFLQGQEMAIACPRPGGMLYQTFDVLGETNGDSPRSYLMIIRPGTLTANEYGTLCLSPNGMLVGLRSDNQCYLAYDTVARRFYGHGDIEALSPFLLIDAAGTLNASDEATILRCIRTEERGVPTREALEDALTHANPAVRASAARLLKAMPTTRPASRW